MLGLYARELPEAFSEYLEEVVELMVPLITYVFHDGIRAAAIKSLPWLLNCPHLKGYQCVKVFLT